MDGRCAFIQRLGHPAPALVLPLRRRGDRVRATRIGGPRHSAERERSVMATASTEEARPAQPDAAARTGEEFLEGLRGDTREIWLNGEQISHPLEHAELRSAAESMASVFDLQHEHADEMLAPSPDDGRLVNVTHLIPRPQVDRSKPEAEQAAGEIALHKIADSDDAIVVRGARMLATLAPFADELLIYPGSDIRPQDGRYALSFAIPIATPGLKLICRDSYSKQRPAFDYPLSSRFDEMDCVVIFDDVEVPKERVFLDGDTVGYSEVITDTGWRGHIMHQAFTRAYIKLCFAFGLGHLIANTIGVVRFDHIQEKLGQIWNMCELTRSAIVSGEAGSYLDE